MPLFDSFSNAASRGDGAGTFGTPPTIPPLYTFNVGTYVTFNTGGQTGPTGPSLSQMIAGMTSNASLSWNINTSFFNTGTYTGYQVWSVPITGTYQIQCYGATGGSSIYYGPAGGQPANITGTFALTQGSKLTITIGQSGANNGYDAGGGGGTFVASGSVATTAIPLIIAGGAGGNSASGGSINASSSQTTLTNANGYGGYSDGYGGRNTGTNGNPGGGGGFYGNGQGNWYGQGFQQGLTDPSYSAYGGFGGGGGGGQTNGAGGGGGWTGGNSTQWSWNGVGGSSYNIGTNQTNTLGSNGAGQNGYCTITRLS